jgi:predicted MFS family arabinose efflux permease
LSTASAWSPLRQVNFAVLWSAALISNTGSWMHDLTAGWFMATLNPSPAMVALVQAATTLPVCLLALPAGTLADRMDKRRLLIIVQIGMMLVAAVLGVLVLQGRAGTHALLGATFALGLGTAIMSPTWQSIIPKLVDREHLQPAVALHAVGMNISRAIGPALAGAIIIAFGIAWPFLINAVSFLAVIAALWWWRPQPTPIAAGTVHAPFLSALRHGFLHAGENRALGNTLWRSVLFFVFGSCYWALLPLVAREQLHGGPGLFGVLVGCIGVGAVSGAMLLPRWRARLGLDRIIVAGTLGTAVALAGFALLRVPALGMAAALIAGASWIASLSSLNVAAQLAVPDAMRARGMALYTAVFYGCLATGSIFWGQVATHLGLSAALLLSACGAVIGLLPAARLTVRPLAAT